MIQIVMTSNFYILDSDWVIRNGWEVVHGRKLFSHQSTNRKQYQR